MIRTKTLKIYLNILCVVFVILIFNRLKQTMEPDPSTQNMEDFEVALNRLIDVDIKNGKGSFSE